MRPFEYDSQMFLLDVMQENDDVFMDDVSYKLK